MKDWTPRVATKPENIAVPYRERVKRSVKALNEKLAKQSQNAPKKTV